jgi:hypothetical protein
LSIGSGSPELTLSEIGELTLDLGTTTAAITANSDAITANSADNSAAITDNSAAVADNSAAITDNSAAVAANTAALNGGAGIPIATNMFCKDHGHSAITSAAECERAAADVVSDTTAFTVSSADFPPGCFVSEGNLGFNRHKSSVFACSGDPFCLCATGLVAAVADNSAAITDNSAAVAANTAALNGGFASLTTGTCVTAGKQAITSADECETAGVALGLIWVGDVFIEDMGNEYPGCFVNWLGVVFNLSGDPTLVCDSQEMEMDMCLCKTPSLANIIARLAALEV